MTPRLYFDDPLRFEFDATVVAHGTFGDRPAVILDRSAFYAEAGGQMADHGRIAGGAVVDVQANENGIVHHVMAEGVPLPAVGTTVRGEILRARRRAHMALHTGQHMLSRALLDVARAETVSSRLGETLCTIDLDVASLDDASIAKAESLVNAVIDDDVSIRAWFPEPGELSALPLRRAPKVTENVRVVSVEGFDVSPCGGTHCVRTSQVGFVRVTAVERYKGKMRVAFTGGTRGRGELFAESGQLRAMARDMTCGVSDVPGVLEKLRKELQHTRESLGATRARVAAHTADTLWSDAHTGGRSVVVAAFDGDGVEFLRQVARRITAHEGAVALLGDRGEDGWSVVAARGAKANVDCGMFVKAVAKSCGGRGGGKPEYAEGKLPAGTDWTAVASEALQAMPAL